MFKFLEVSFLTFHFYENFVSIGCNLYVNIKFYFTKILNGYFDNSILISKLIENRY